MKIAILVTFFVCAFLFFISFFPFKLSAKAYIDIAKNGGFYCFRLLGFRILCGRMQIDKGKLRFENQGGRLQNDPNASTFLPIFVSQLYKNLDVVALDLYFEGGLDDNPDMSAVMCGSVETIVSIIFAYLKTKNDMGSFRKNIAFIPTSTECNFVLDGALAVSLFDIFKSLIAARMELKHLAQTSVEEKKQ